MKKAKTLSRRQLLRTDIKTAWDYFSSPMNLAEITPDWLNFQVIADVPEKMYEGLMIEYRVHPLLGLPVSWVTEITHADEPHYFVDEQRAGPYRLWHHEHHFKVTPDGVEMTDIVTYILKAEPLSHIMLGSTVRKKLNEIFDYRHRVLEAKFNSDSYK